MFIVFGNARFLFSNIVKENGEENIKFIFFYVYELK
jgi:hypothetical protein